jgi:hypothetical protein
LFRRVLSNTQAPFNGSAVATSMATPGKTVPALATLGREAVFPGGDEMKAASSKRLAA